MGGFYKLNACSWQGSEVDAKKLKSRHSHAISFTIKEKPCTPKPKSNSIAGGAARGSVQMRAPPER
jgi:hypothetical protein